ncbi:hypothetical protein RRSWK_01378 [Rhodopirellula sp. SWK7]|nr:hypothetical protein RRSWK_01378 [Rhodopirellula sp. SWK7]
MWVKCRKMSDDRLWLSCSVAAWGGGNSFVWKLFRELLKTLWESRLSRVGFQGSL